jgi:L-histidine Nalpha-methyltransferase
MSLISTQPSLPEAVYTPLGSEVYSGLTSFPKRLNPWLFYDEEGSQLFEKITELPEYYVTRTERGIFASYANEIISAASAQQNLTIIELGAGTATKTGLLLSAAVRSQGTVLYQPIDISATALDQACQRIPEEIPGVTVLPRVANYTEGLNLVEAGGCRKLVLYIGSSIGNFEPEHARALLKSIRRQLAPGDSLLLGVDLVKDLRLLLAAYNDTSGVTAAFNKNVLARMNRELEANFNLKRFRHRAIWNREKSRIEMHLESLIAQRVSLSALELDIAFVHGETIHTENSYKYTHEGVLRMLASASFQLHSAWNDSENWFGVFLATAI